MKKSLVCVVATGSLVLGACSDGNSEEMTVSNVIETPTTVMGTESVADTPSIETAEDWVKQAAGMTTDQNFSDAAVDDTLPAWAAVITGADIADGTLTVSIDEAGADAEGEAQDVLDALSEFARNSDTQAPEPFTTIDVVNSSGDLLVGESV